MDIWLKSVLISAMTAAPLTYFAGTESLSVISGDDLPKMVQPSLASYAQQANDFVYDLKVQTGVVPAPTL